MNAMRQDAQKQSRKFCRSKEGKNSETHPEKPEKGETGCVSGAGEGCSGWRRMWAGEKTRKARRKSRDGLVSAAASVGPGRSPPGCRPPRHALRRAQPHLVAESLCALTKNREASIVLASLFLAGAEGLEPSARGFGVDVGESTRERGRGGVGRFLLQVTKRAVLGWCCEEISGPKGRENPGKAGNTLTRIDKDRIIKVPGLLPAGRLLQTGG